LRRSAAYTFGELVVAIATAAILCAILTPVLANVAASKVSNKPNLTKISAAAIAYGHDFDEHIPLLANGSFRNVSARFVSALGEKRTDLWPLILLPYVKDRRVYQDPRRDDVNKIWSGPPLDWKSPTYNSMGNTFSNQNRFPCFGVNYIFLSPMLVNSSGPMGGQDTTSVSKSFAAAKDPAQTIFYCVSSRGNTPTGADDGVGYSDNTRGFFAVDPPGMWGLNDEKYDYQIFWTGTNCSGDWCADADPKTPGRQRATNFVYMEKVLGGNNVAFLDGHVKFMNDVQMTAGTNYWDATPNGEENGGGAKITDKSAYLWDLDGDFYGLY
jgi:prepilin-type processing-associated H-X9-DG protein